MAEVGALQVAGLVLLGLAFVVASAKVHGRQMRLRRQAEGHMHVNFRKENHPWVEALWKRDRIIFWPLFGILAVAAVAVGWFSLGNAQEFVGLAAWLLTILLIGWAFALTFLLVGVWWAFDLARSDHTTSIGLWMESLGWLVLALAIGAGQLVLAIGST